MSKTKAIVFILLLSPIIAGFYGILHDQFTYSISEEYYTKFKFHQFGLSDNKEQTIFLNPRFLVCIVGFMATWWFGALIGSILCLSVITVKNPNNLFRNLMNAVLLNLLIAFLIGLIGLLVGYILDEEKFHFPYNLSNKSAFLMVGAMHTFGYIGGVLGLVVGIIYLKRERKFTT